MKVKELRCDICHGVIDTKYETSYEYIEYKGSRMRHGRFSKIKRRLDLCEYCNDKMSNWIIEGKREAEREKSR